MHTRRLLLLGITLFALSPVIHAQTDTISASAHRLKTQVLKDGSMRYLVYMEDSLTGIKSKVSIWERTTAHALWQNKPAIAITQTWYGADSQHMVRRITSYCDAHTFLPLYHHTFLSYAGGKKRTDVFNFSPTAISAPAGDTADNKGFTISLQQPTFNWELDMETFSMLPFAKGKTFAINFYHPGSTVGPKFYRYTVEGEEKLESMQGKKIDCWKLTCYYDGANYSTWWIDKHTCTVVKMKERYNGRFRYKLLLVV